MPEMVLDSWRPRADSADHIPGPCRGPPTESRVQMAETSTVEGTLVALYARPYKSFPNKTTGEMIPAGVTRFAYLVRDFDEQPIEVKLDEASYVELQRAGFGAQATLLVELDAKSDGRGGAILSRRCVSLVRTTAAA